MLYIGDITSKGDNTVIVVNAPANKNNKALDVVVGDAWLVVEGQFLSLCTVNSGFERVIAFCSHL